MARIQRACSANGIEIVDDRAVLSDLDRAQKFFELLEKELSQISQI